MKPHRCTDCRKADARTPPRPIVWTSPSGRIERCRTHRRAQILLDKWKAYTAYVARKFRISREDQEALWRYQGERCGACGKKPTRFPDSEHDRRLARQHDHLVEEGCPECFRGLCCRGCNREVLDRYTPAQLRAIADYLEDPPYQRMRRERDGVT